MRGTNDRRTRVFHLMLSALAIVLLTVLSWGLVNGNIISTVLAGVGLACTITMAGFSLMVQDDRRSQATERMLTLASATQYHMRDGLTPEGCRAVCQLLLPETEATAIAMTDRHETLAYVGEVAYIPGEGTPNTASTNEVLENGRIQTFSKLDETQWKPVDGVLRGLLSEAVRSYPLGIIVPLTVSERTVGTIKLYYRSGSDISRNQLVLARGFAALLSSQLTVHELDRQAEAAAQAEVKALQAQINPHFLFNTLNTIAAFTRTDPTRARDLLREFAVFYRRTLEGTEAPISLSDELEQTRRYLLIERARFGDERIVWTEDVEEGCGDVKVPAFIVQPIVENAVRHAMRDEGPLHIDVQVATDDEDVLIAVADDGVGMDDEIAARLLGDQELTRSKGGGTGIALRNVADRIELFYGEGSGIEILSKVGSGTCVTLRLVGVAPTGAEMSDDDWDEQG